MRVWRISNYADLSGTGGILAAARWHNKGLPIIYTAEHAAGALTELLVHIDRRDIPRGFQLIGIEVDAGASVEVVDESHLPHDWRADLSITRAVGDGWLAGRKSLALRVPSVIVPHAYNVLLNPSHPELTKVRIVSIDRVPLDPRLMPS